MGAWSPAIMGSDTALDVQAELYEYLGVTREDENRADVVKAAIEKATPEELVGFIDNHEYYPNIAGQVVAVTTMTTGATFAPEVQAAALKSCEFDEQYDGDFRNPEARQEILDELKQSISAYDGTAIQIDSRGPLETVMAGRKGENNGR